MGDVIPIRLANDPLWCQARRIRTRLRGPLARLTTMAIFRFLSDWCPRGLSDANALHILILEAVVDEHGNAVSAAAMAHLGEHDG